MKRCPFCSKRLRNEAIICHICGKDLVSVYLGEEPLPENYQAPQSIPQRLVQWSHLFEQEKHKAQSHGLIAHLRDLLGK